MPSPPFSPRATEPRSFLGKILGREPKRNALIAFNNALCDAPTLTQIPGDLVERINQEYGVDLRRDFSGELAVLYRDALRHLISDHHLSEEDQGDLHRLSGLFGLRPAVQQAIHAELAEPIYREALTKFLADHRLEHTEKRELESVKAALQLSDESASALFREAAQAAIQRLADTVSSDKRISPEEDKELQRFASELGATIEHDEDSRRALERMRRHWVLENRPLADLAVPVSLNLQRNEVAVFATRCEWLERRQQTERIRYGGPAVSFRIMKGVYYRAGDYKIERVTREVMTTVDAGELCLTSKRLIFRGDRKSLTVQLGRILDFTPYRDGIEVVKGSGKNPIFSFTDRLDEFGVLLYRLTRSDA